MLRKQEACLKGRQEASFVSISQEGHKTANVNLIKAEFVNLVKVRKIVINRLL